MRSNSLDIKLKKTEKELKQHEQEIADQLELHELTVKELELTKTSHKIAQEEIKQHKQKVYKLWIYMHACIVQKLSYCSICTCACIRIVVSYDWPVG